MLIRYKKKVISEIDLSQQVNIKVTAIIVDEVTVVLAEVEKEEVVDAEAIKLIRLLTIIVRILVRNHKNKTTKPKITMVNKLIRIKSPGDNAIKKSILKSGRTATKKLIGRLMTL